MKRVWIVAGVLIPIAAALVVYTAYRDTNALDICRYRLKRFPLSDSLGGLRIALLSDLHIRVFGSREERILAILEREKPDLILLAGDYIHYQSSFLPALRFFKKLNAPLGVFAVLGNAEYSNENGTCILCHEGNSEKRKSQAKPVFLRNSTAALSWKEKPFVLIGLDDPVTKRRSGRPNHDFEKAVSRLGPNERLQPRIMLTHSPETFPELSGKADLILAGHNHGGQIFLLKYLRGFSREPSLDYLEGFFENFSSLMYVGRGTGTSLLPFRFGVRPEIAIFDIAHPEDPGSNPDKSLETDYAGWDARLLAETFNFVPYLKKKIRTNRYRTESVLFDFENREEMQSLNQQCHKRLQRTRKFATSGSFSLHVKLPRRSFSGVQFENFRSDWSRADFLKLDIYNPRPGALNLYLRIDDPEARDNAGEHLDRAIAVRGGMNRISIALKGLQTNTGKRHLNLHAIERMVLYPARNTEPVEFYLDCLRLE